jgi:hypothetical protein
MGRMVGLVLGLALVATWTADAAVICQKKSGALLVRPTACKKKETAVNLADFGAVGPKGDPGDPGTAGASATNLWCVVDADATRARGSSHCVSSGHPAAIFAPRIVATSGTYEVIFDRDVSACAYVATLGDVGVAGAPHGTIGTASRLGNANGVYVETRDSTGTLANIPFHLAVFCDQ